MVPIYSDYVDGGLNLNQNRQLDDDDIENEKKTIKSTIAAICTIFLFGLLLFTCVIRQRDEQRSNTLLLKNITEFNREESVSIEEGGSASARSGLPERTHKRLRPASNDRLMALRVFTAV
ncbi:hypothetical protein BLOT_005075 [Blomia tropicalis]|nr:hypothetical protein BLOT_005075 [Blomia tropicalis]